MIPQTYPLWAVVAPDAYTEPVWGLVLAWTVTLSSDAPLGQHPSSAATGVLLAPDDGGRTASATYGCPTVRDASRAVVYTARLDASRAYDRAHHRWSDR